MKKIVYTWIILCMFFLMFPLQANAETDSYEGYFLCKIGDVKYRTLEEAIDNVKDGETITLQDHCRDAVKIDKQSEINFTIDLDGNYITGTKSEKWNTLEVYSGNVTIKNGYITSQTRGNMNVESEEQLEDFATAIYACSNVNLYNVTLSVEDEYGSAFYVEDGANVTMDDCKIRVNGDYGGGVTVSAGGALTMTNSMVEGSLYNKMESGVVIYGKASLNNVRASFIDNCIYVESKEPVIISSSNMSGVKTTFLIYNSPNIVIDGGKYQSQTNALYSENSNISIGQSEWSASYEYKAFAGDSCINLKPETTPLQKNWRDEYAVEFINSINKASLSDSSPYGATSAKIKWADICGADKYEIYRSTKALSGYKKIKTVTDVEDKKTYSYIDKGRIRYKTYYYKVKAIAYNPKVTSLSGYKKIKINVVAPKLNIAHYNKSLISYEWKEIPGTDGYQFYYKVGKNGKWRKEYDMGHQDWQFSTSYAFGKTYYFKMRAYDKINGKKYYSPYSNTVKYYHKPVPVKNLQVNAVDKGVKLTWSKAYAISGYQIYRSTSENGTYSKIKSISGAKYKTFTDQTVKDSKTYYYKVRSYAKVNGKIVPGAFSSKVKITF